MLGGVVKGYALHTCDLLELLKQPLRLFIGDIGYHQICGAVGDKLLFHHLQTLLGLGIRGQVGGQIVFHFDPVAGDEGESHGNADQQKDQVALIHYERGKLYHKAAAVLVFIIHV